MTPHTGVTTPPARTRHGGIPVGRRAEPRRTPTPRGFTIVELIVCLGVITVLCGILLPSLRATREAARRMSCASNQRQIGAALSAYAMTNDDLLPPSGALRPEAFRPWELMAARHGPGTFEPVDDVGGWDGLGLLVRGSYVGDDCQCLHCASHHGEHPFERYAGAYATGAVRSQIYTNYHYSGHVQYPDAGAGIGGARRVSLNDGHTTVLLSDGLRTQLDFNHRVGLNRMWADLSVEWVSDSQNSLFTALPPDPSTLPGDAPQRYGRIWETISDPLTR
jgi:type II secretory pathway pseudopilin PulG